MRHLTASWARLASRVESEDRSLLDYDRYYGVKRLVIRDGSGYHPSADIDRAKAKQQAAYETWRAKNPGVKRPDRYKPERAQAWMEGGYENFNAATATLGTAAFVDYEVYDGNVVRIAFASVRPDKRGQGLMRELITALYDKYPNATINWGKMMEPEIGTLYRSFQQSHPKQTGSASVYY